MLIRVLRSIASLAPVCVKRHHAGCVMTGRIRVPADTIPAAASLGELDGQARIYHHALAAGFSRATSSRRVSWYFR
jgi:hypothetical protein